MWFGETMDAHFVFFYHKKRNCCAVWNASILRMLGRTVIKVPFSYGTKLESRVKKGIFAVIKCFDKGESHLLHIYINNKVK